MAKRGASDDEQLLARLREAVSGEQATKQLKRRYDSLRKDYELLLDRLADIEQRMELQDSPSESAPVPPPPPRAAPQHAAPPPAATARLTESLMAPLMQLREEYLAAATSINAIVGGLDSLAAGAMKGQRRTASPDERSAAIREDTPTRPRSVQVDVKGQGFGDLLDFQERLSELQGVTRVSINAIDNDRATLLVELSNGHDE